MNTRALQTATALVLALIGLHILGYLFPSAFTWGFHAFGFLPLQLLLLYLILAIAVLLLARLGILERAAAAAVGFMEKSQYQFLVTVIGIFILSSLVFKVRVPLLGDSFFLVKNFSEALRNTGPLLYRNEPLATYYFYSVIHLFQPTTYAGFLSAFLGADIILETGFILCAFFITKSLFADPVDRLLVFVLLLVVPSIQLCFGYVEVYAAVL